MTEVPPPAWLGPALAAFSAALAAPLRVQDGRRSAAPAPAALRALLRDGGGPGLTLYQEQVWARFFGAVQAELPRLTAALGPWTMNELAAVHLAAHPPAAADLGRCADGLAAALAAALGAPSDPATAPDRRPAATAAAGPFAAALAPTTTPAGLLVQAARLDEAVRAALRAPDAGVWRPTPAEAAALPAHRLRPAPSLRLLRLDWDLVAPPPPAEAPARPAPLDRPMTVVVHRGADRAVLTPVAPAFARLLARSVRQPFGAALDALLVDASPEARAAAEAALPGWINAALAAGWWVGLDAPPER